MKKSGKVKLLPKNTEKNEAMAAYMKNKYPFLGWSAPERKILSKEIITRSKKMKEADCLEFIHNYYELLEREYQYIAIDIAIANVKRFSIKTVLSLSTLVMEKAWWDSVDAWRKFFAKRVQLYPKELETIFLAFYQREEFWMRRISINLQLLRKNETDTTLLAKAILFDQTTEEFFIQKAIGWSLREYSKTNPMWVKNFMEQHKLSNLAIKEGSKYL